MGRTRTGPGRGGWWPAAHARAVGRGEGRPARARARTRTGPGARRETVRTHARTHDARAGPRPRPWSGRPGRRRGRWEGGPARPARSFTYSKRHPCGRPTALTFWALLPSPSPAGAPGTPTSSAPSRPAPRPAAAAAAARTPGLRRRLSCLRRRHRHLPWLFRPAGPLHPQLGARRLCRPLSPLPALASPRSGGPLRPPARARGRVLRRRRAGSAPRQRRQSACGQGRGLRRTRLSPSGTASGLLRAPSGGLCPLHTAVYALVLAWLPGCSSNAGPLSRPSPGLPTSSLFHLWPLSVTTPSPSQRFSDASESGNTPPLSLPPPWFIYHLLSGGPGPSYGTSFPPCSLFPSLARGCRWRSPLSLSLGCSAPTWQSLAGPGQALKIAQ